jgi:hypothetical protein
MPKDWSFRTRVKVAAVAALLGLLVWADAHYRGDAAECASYGVHTDGRVALPAELVDHGVVCTR